MTFMRKFMDMLNMNNWTESEKKNTEILCSSSIDTPNHKESVSYAKAEKQIISQKIKSDIPDLKENVKDVLPKINLSSSAPISEENTKDPEHMMEKEDSLSVNDYESDLEEENNPYKSNRLIINGVHLYFIDIAREIVEQRSVNIIPLMREYHLSENELMQIINQIQEAKILDINQNVTMSIDEFEKFIDIYEPSIFECTHSIFDKELFMVIGEIIFDKGVEDTYNSLPANEVIDYLNIMENLKVIAYDDYRNKYDILISKLDFDNICECIPSSFSNTNYKDSDIDYSNADFDNMSGIEFENYCAHILSKNGFTNIKITPSSGDHGIDILALRNEITYAIQCKCYSDNVGNSAVQQAHTGKSLYHKDIAVVMTNRYFTPQAIEEANALGVKLWNRDKLNEMIGSN